MIDGNGECACAPDKYLTSPPTRFGKRQGFVPTCEPCSVKYNSQTTACTETEAKAWCDTAFLYKCIARSGSQTRSRTLD